MASLLANAAKAKRPVEHSEAETHRNKRHLHPGRLGFGRDPSPTHARLPSPVAGLGFCGIAIESKATNPVPLLSRLPRESRLMISRNQSERPADFRMAEHHPLAHDGGKAAEGNAEGKAGSAGGVQMCTCVRVTHA